MTDVEDFQHAVAGVLDRLWPDAVAAGHGDLGPVAAAAAEQGWWQLGESGALDFLIGAVRVLGARSCPLPLADAYAVAHLLPERAEEIGAGAMVPVVVAADDTDPLVDDAGLATHLLVVDPSTGGFRLCEVAATEPAGGLARPDWSRVRAGDVLTEGSVSATQLAEALGVLRLALAARAVAAAGRVHELAVAHATVRVQFGRVIGGFGAVQQRTAACQVDLSACQALIDEAVLSATQARFDAPLAAALAARHARTAATRILAGGQHTLGAVGFFEEHEAAWLFRRVHADVTVLSRGLLDDRRPEGVADRLLAGESLPHFALGDTAERFRAEIQALLASHRDDAGGYDVEALRREMDEQNLFALNWPAEHGGRPAEVEEQVVLQDEMKYAGGPVDRAMSATMLIGHSILRHGTPDQKAQFLPLLHSGTLAFCLGYSEPEAGSDLASLRTRAVPDGDDWVIDGQKLWTTRGHTASHVWLAVRTDPEAQPRHAGITIFLVPMDTDGITVQQHTALSGEISCTVFYDRVRVPDSARVGEVNGGWRVITDALTAERVLMGGVAATLRRNFDELLSRLRLQEKDIDALDRDRLAWVASRLQAARALVLRAIRAMDGGSDARIAGPMAAVLSGDLAEELGRTSLDLLGPQAALSGIFDAALRVAPMYVIGGGTNDIQRGLIARGLGLSRE